MNAEEQLRDWLTQLDTISNEAFTHFGSLTKEALHWKPNPNAWSIAENLTHLIALNTSYFPVWQKARLNKLRLPWFARIRFIVKTLGKVLLKSVQPDRKRRVQTFPIWMPIMSDEHVDVVALFKEHQAALKGELSLCEPLIGKSVVIHSPASAKIVYSFEDAVALIIAHERRHLVQAKEVLSALLDRENQADPITSEQL
jgi:hypothetical protein